MRMIKMMRWLKPGLQVSQIEQAVAREIRVMSVGVLSSLPKANNRRKLQARRRLRVRSD